MYYFVSPLIDYKPPLCIFCFDFQTYKLNGNLYNQFAFYIIRVFSG